MAEDITTGYCVVCGGYGRGRYVWPINDREEAIDQHQGCSGSRPPRAEQPRRHHSVQSKARR